MRYPLNLSFKLLAIANQIYVRDATGALICYVKQKAFKLKEAITVFEDEEQTRPMFTINADRIIDFSARYQFADMTGKALGALRRQGMRSMWKADYDVLDGDTVVMKINEENGWVKVGDAVLREIPLVGILSGYVLNPSYVVKRPDGTPVLRVKKEPAMLEGRFSIESLAPVPPQEEFRAILGILMMLLLERMRG